MRGLSLFALMSKRSRRVRLLVLLTVFVLGYLASLAVQGDTELASHQLQHHHHQLQEQQSDAAGGEEVHFQVRRLLNSSSKSNYPPDIFSQSERRKGAVVLHVIGLIYMFVALAVVCDEFFVPSLGVITEKLEISEDVAGATFMAAGGSAPELFTSFIGVFIATSDVGIGTIVGSAVFNILFVIGMCALFSKELLHLTWWPLFRDVLFYSVGILLLIGFFIDDKIYWWEALVLFLFYIAYVLFMKYNHVIEAKVKGCLKKTGTRNKVQSADQLLQQRRPSRRMSIPTLHSGPGRYRHGVLQLMIHTIDPLSEEDQAHDLGHSHSHGHSQRLGEPHGHSSRRKSSAKSLSYTPQPPREEGKVHEKAMQLQTIATVQLVINHGNGQNGTATQVDKENNVKIQVISNGRVSEDTTPSANTPNSQQTSLSTPERDGDDRLTGRDVAVSVQSPQHTVDSNSSNETTAEAAQPDDDEEEPLDLSWPDSWKKRVTYIILVPIMFVLWLMLPDVRRPEKRKWFPITFLGSIMWIAIFSYLMVWWANQTGKTIGISDEIMGLTILAAGTSIPDLITSVIVAKKGFGDMAVSSSVGSNIFDITVGLPLPWILYGAINGGDPYVVSSKGLPCAMILLFLMLVIVIVCIALSKWSMSKVLGFSMLILYLVFVTLSVLLEIEIIECLV